MRIVRPSAISLLLLVALTTGGGCRSARRGTAGNQERPGETSLHEDPRIAACEAAASQIRHLSFHAPIRTRVRDQEDLDTAVQSHATRLVSDPHWTAYQAALTRFGLIPEGFDLMHFRQALQAEQLGGYYLPSRNTVVVVDKHVDKTPPPSTRGSTPALDAETLRNAMLVHEFTHALQFQNLGHLQAFRPPGGAGPFYDDAMLARKSLLEGDAMFVTIQYLLGPTRPLEYALDAGRTMAEMLAHTDSPWTTVMASGPPALRDLLLFPYLFGLDFVARLLRERGWSVVNAAYAAPPVSTEQIIHPSRYLEGERPMLVTVGGVEDLLDAGYRTVATGSWGELGVSLILHHARGVRGEGRAASGWGGDVYHVLRHRDAWMVVWALAWDRAEDARAFCESWHSMDGRDQAFPAHYDLMCRGRVTLLLWGMPRPDIPLEELLDTVQTTVRPPRPPLSVHAALEPDRSGKP